MRETWVQSLVGKIPCKRERLPTPVFWPGEFHWLYSPWGHKGWIWFIYSLSHSSHISSYQWLHVTNVCCIGHHACKGVSSPLKVLLDSSSPIENFNFPIKDIPSGVCVLEFFWCISVYISAFPLHTNASGELCLTFSFRSFPWILNTL